MIPGAPESVVNLTVSGGPNFIPPTVSAVVPNVLGMNVESARALLKENGFIIRNITYTVSAEANDTVLWQSETANSTVSGPEGEIPIDLIVAINS
jgi:beta-lactam-binding protein with PASTA domain